MDCEHERGFQIGRLDGLTWGEIEGHAAEVSREHGDVLYRGEFVATMFNDEWGGDVLDDSDEPMTEEQVQARIAEIDADLADAE